MLEPRHVVTPAARDPEADLPAARRGHGARPGGAHGRAPNPRRRHGGDALRPARARARLGFGLLPVPGLEHAIGFKSLADAIWLRNHVSRPSRPANATEDPARRAELLTYVFVGGGYAGLEALAELQDFAADAMDATRARGSTGCAGSWSRPRTGSCPRSTRRSPTTRPGAPGARDRDPAWGRRSRRSTPTAPPCRPGRRSRPDVVWTAGRPPHPSLPALAFRSTSVGGSRSTTTARRGDAGRVGDRRLRRGPDPGRGLAPPTAQHAIRQARWSPANVAADLGVGEPRRYRYSSRTAFVNLGRYKAVGRYAREPSRGFLAWWMARTYHLSQIPGAFRKLRAGDRLDGQPAVRPRPRRGRLDRPPAAAAQRGVRARRQPTARWRASALRAGRTYPGASGPAPLRDHRAQLRPRDRDHRSGEGELVLDLARWSGP